MEIIHLAENDSLEVGVVITGNIGVDRDIFAHPSYSSSPFHGGLFHQYKNYSTSLCITSHGNAHINGTINNAKNFSLQKDLFDQVKNGDILTVIQENRVFYFLKNDKEVYSRTLP